MDVDPNALVIFPAWPPVLAATPVAIGFWLLNSRYLRQPVTPG